MERFMACTFGEMSHSEWHLRFPRLFSFNLGVSECRSSLLDGYGYTRRLHASGCFAVRKGLLLA
jgi:hypothetical protein